MDPNQFAVTFTVTAGQVANLYLGGCGTGTTMDWGDGSAVEPLAEGVPVVKRPHTYATAGTYQAVLTGTFAQIGYNGQSNTEMAPLVSVDHWGADVGTSTAAFAFYFCQKLTSVVDPPPGITDMMAMFKYASLFNGDISGWDTSAVVNLSQMFHSAGAFNRDLSAWDTAQVLTMQSMFTGAAAFNGDISTWDTGRVFNMSNMFYGAGVFNGDLSAWNTVRATNMSSMFSFATAFTNANPDLTPWPVPLIPSRPSNFTEVSEAVWPAARQPQWGTMGASQGPPVPEEVAVVTHSPTVLEVTWDEVPGATGYQIRINGGEPIDA